MADAPKNSTGFATMAQTQGGGGGSSAPQITTADENLKGVVAQINKAISQYDEHIKKYLAEAFLYEDKPQEALLDTIRAYMSKTGFTDKKITDTPTESLMLVNRQFVTLNGATGSRPSSPVRGQYYWNTSTGQPEWYNGSGWKTASVVGA